MIHINTEVCTGCAICMQVCSLACIKMEDGKALWKGGRRCITCGHCIAACPEDAVSTDSYDNNESVMMTPDTEIASWEAMKNRMMFRRSMRSYRKKAPSKEEIMFVLEGARYAGTGGNRQALRYVAVQEDIKKITAMAAQVLGQLSKNQGFYGPAYERIFRESQSGNDILFYGAPYLVLVIGDRKKGFNVKKDGGLAAAYIQLLGETLGIGSCINGFFADAVEYSRELRQELGIGTDEVMVHAIAMGYPAVSYIRSAPRKTLDVTWS